MNAKLFTFLFLIFLFGIGLVGAAPPTEAIVVEAGIDINFPTISPIEVNKDFSFHFHTINDSNGVWLDETDITCTFHLYNASGKHIVEYNHDVARDGNGLEWSVKVTAANWSYVGEYSWLFDCNSTVQQISGSVQAQLYTTNKTNYGLFLILIIGAIILSLAGIFLDDQDWLLFLAGLLYIMSGMYVMIYGIFDLTDLYTRSLAGVCWALGVVFITAAIVNSWGSGEKN